MPCEILVVGAAKTGITEKGFPWVVRDSPVEWGNKEVPPNWVIVKIADATKEQVDNYLQSWKKTFIYNIISENQQGYRIRIEVDPALVSVSGDNKDLRSDLKNYVVNNYAANIVSQTTTEAVLDIAKPVDLQEIKADIHDKFSERFSARKYYFSGADVDIVLLNGGVVELTKAQVLARIKSKLDD